MYISLQIIYFIQKKHFLHETVFFDTLIIVNSFLEIFNNHVFLNAPPCVNPPPHVQVVLLPSRPT